MTWWRVGLTVAAWGVLTVSLWASDADPAVVVLGGAVAVVSASMFAGLDLARSAVGVKWPERDVGAGSVKDRDRRVSSFMSIASTTARLDSTHLHDTLVELIDDRLQAHHGIDRARAPEDANAVLTPTLQQLVARPRRRVAMPRELRQVLSDIEAL
jgi:hypothetical protein